MELKRAIDLFLGEHIETTRRSYMYVLQDMRDFVGPNRPLTTIAPDALIEYLQIVRARPSIKSTASVNKYVKTVRTFFNWCVKVELISSSPAKALKYRRQDEAIPRKKAFPDHHYDRLIDYGKWDPRALALVLFLGDTGCRIGGAAGLRWNDLNFDSRMTMVTEKGQPPREVFWGEECQRALLNWRKVHPMSEGDYVFSRTGKRIQNNNLGQYFRRVCQRTGVGSWGPHSLRHRKGHQLADSRTAASVAARALGDTVEIMMKYYYPDDLERVREAIEELSYKGDAQPSKIRRFSS